MGRDHVLWRDIVGLVAGAGSEPETGGEQASLCLGTIEISEDGIAERTREGQRAVFVPRSTIERVTAGYGFTSERPVAAFLGAAIFLGGAAIILWRVIPTLNGHYLVTKVRILMVGVLFAAVGALFLWTLVRRGRYLRVDTARDSRKLMVRGANDPQALRELLHLARSRFGYAIDMSSLEDG
jgi:hypothetical protein